MKAKKFWMVLRDNPGSGAHTKHATLRDAKEEAMRLCEKERSKFFILKTVELIQPKEVPFEAEWKKL